MSTLISDTDEYPELELIQTFTCTEHEFFKTDKILHINPNFLQPPLPVKVVKQFPIAAVTYDPKFSGLKTT